MTELGEVTPRSQEVLEIVSDMESLLRPAICDHERAATIVELAMLRVRMVVSPIPEGARPILVDMSLRAYNNPQSAAYETAGPFARQFSKAGVYLMENERADLEALAAGQTGMAAGAFTIRPGARR